MALCAAGKARRTQRRRNTPSPFGRGSGVRGRVEEDEVRLVRSLRARARLLALTMLAAAIAACGGAPAAETPTVAPAATSAPAPTVAQNPTAAPAATSAPAPTAAPAATSAPAPTTAAQPDVAVPNPTPEQGTAGG